MNDIILSLNENKFISAITILILNIGAKYISGDLTKFQDSLFKSNYFKKIILISMFFVATRDILISFLLTIVYTILIDFLLNENSDFFIFPNNYNTFNNYIKNIIKINKNN